MPTARSSSWVPAFSGEWAFRDLPFCLAFAIVRLIAFLWCTTRRMTRGPISCLYGCSAVGGDDVRHYLMRPRLAVAAGQQGRRPSPWIGTGNLRISSLALPMNRPDVCSACVWALPYTGFIWSAGLGGAPMTRIIFLRSIHAVIRPIAARTSAGRDVVFGSPGIRRRA